MARNEGTPSAGRRTGAPGSVVFAGDTSEISPNPSEIQIRRLRARFDFSPSVAATIAALAFPQVDSWRGRA